MSDRSGSADGQLRESIEFYLPLTEQRSCCFVPVRSSDHGNCSPKWRNHGGYVTESHWPGKLRLHSKAKSDERTAAILIFASDQETSSRASPICVYAGDEPRQNQPSFTV